MPQLSQREKHSANGEYDHIILTDEEISYALKNARKEKHYREKNAAYWQTVNTEKEYPNYTSDELLAIVLKNFSARNKREFVIDKFNEPIMILLCQYFTGSKNGLDPNKGLFLFGGVGVGKTEMMGMFCLNQKQSYGIFSCNEIVEDFIQSGQEEIGRFYTMPRTYANHPFGQQFNGFCFDDLGTETIPAAHYADKKNVMADIILARYSNALPFNATHITTNLSKEEITANYGSRVLDRMREMFNLIEFPTDAKSRRG